VRINIALDDETGKKRGFCQIEFEKPEEAQKAVAELTN
jgi:RNA recognition motif-containing protein